MSEKLKHRMQWLTSQEYWSAQQRAGKLRENSEEITALMQSEKQSEIASFSLDTSVIVVFQAGVVA